MTLLPGRKCSKTPDETEDGHLTRYITSATTNGGSPLFVETLEKCLMQEGIISKPAEKEFLPMQPGDVYQTYADVDELERDFGFKPNTSLEEGLSRFAKWYKKYYNL